MKRADATYCPFCTGEILEAEFLCKYCGRDLHAMRIAHSKAKASSKGGGYEIVPDGFKFGIALRGTVILHGMEMEEAQNTAKILNTVLEAEKAELVNPTRYF